MKKNPESILLNQVSCCDPFIVRLIIGANMEINTHYFESLSLKEVKELLPPNHSIKQVDTQGLQEAGCYFVVSVGFCCPM
ncbi:hypothetical protein E2C01_047975 [Portunus trituberculatus]|uniref:Uncharacterized protein n=1 Tax=Portunus trituberculatus TaxID=210409 RepID=A0A5B7GAA5_PORTR|nr:hypothetical protein [Portunus trituberculatus]